MEPEDNFIFLKKIDLTSGGGPYPKPRTQEAETGISLEFKGRLVYRATSRIARTIQRNLIGFLTLTLTPSLYVTLLLSVFGRQ